MVPQNISAWNTHVVLKNGRSLATEGMETTKNRGLLCG